MYHAACACGVKGSSVQTCLGGVVFFTFIFKQKDLFMANQDSTEKLQLKEYAKTVWCPGDVQALRPAWSLERCAQELENNEKYLRDGLVGHGFELLGDLLPE